MVEAYACRYLYHITYYLHVALGLYSPLSCVPNVSYFLKGFHEGHRFPSMLRRIKEYDEDNYYALFDVCSYHCFKKNFNAN